MTPLSVARIAVCLSIPTSPYAFATAATVRIGMSVASVMTPSIR